MYLEKIREACELNNEIKVIKLALSQIDIDGLNRIIDWDEEILLNGHIVDYNGREDCPVLCWPMVISLPDTVRISKTKEYKVRFAHNKYLDYDKHIEDDELYRECYGDNFDLNPHADIDERRFTYDNCLEYVLEYLGLEKAEELIREICKEIIKEKQKEESNNE